MFWVVVAAAALAALVSLVMVVHKWATAPRLRHQDVQEAVDSLTAVENAGARLEGVEVTVTSPDGRSAGVKARWDATNVASPDEVQTYEDAADRRALREAGYVPGRASSDRLRGAPYRRRRCRRHRLLIHPQARSVSPGPLRSAHGGQ